MYLNKIEKAQGENVVKEVKETTGKDKVIVIQPFGRTTEEDLIDVTSRSFRAEDMLDIANELKKDFAVILMSEIQLNMKNTKDDNIPIAQPQIPDIRVWAGVINAADHFLGCDSVGQHIAKALDTQSTVVIGSTYPINTSYVDDKSVTIFDIGKDMRVYSPIRITNEEEPDRVNDKCMDLSKAQTKDIVDSIRKKLGKPNKTLLSVGGSK